MTSTDRIRAHYSVTGLVDRIRQALSEIAPDEAVLAPEELAGLDQFHTRGLAATLDLARDAALQPGERVLDIGCGLGGPARLLASRFGVVVTGIDLSPPFIEAGRYLNRRCGLEDRVQLEVGDGARLTKVGADFDVVLLQHVAMNIADRAGFYRDVRRVLAPGGRFATYDIVRDSGVPDFPVPWAATPDTSFLLTADQTRTAIEASSFRARIWRDDTDAARAFFSQLAQTAQSPGLSLGLVTGPDFRVAVGNLARSVMESRVAVLAGVFEAV